MILYPARVEWKSGDTILAWDGVLESVIEVFGLPGARYVTELDADYMDFKFYTKEDQLLFLTGWPARALPEQR